VAARNHLVVTCLTCGSRLRVTDRQLIGSISNCPKCGAMVEIKADDPPVAATDAPTATKPATPIGRLNDKASPAPPVVTTADAAKGHTDRPSQIETAGRLAVGDEAGIDSGALTQSSVATADDFAPPPQSGAAFSAALNAGPNAPESPETAIDRPLDPVSLPADPSIIWQSTSSRRFSQFSFVVTLAVFGLIVATVAFIQFARSYSTDVKQTAQAIASQDIAAAGQAEADTRPQVDTTGNATGEAKADGEGTAEPGDDPLLPDDASGGDEDAASAEGVDDTGSDEPETDEASMQTTGNLASRSGDRSSAIGAGRSDNDPAAAPAGGPSPQGPAITNNRDQAGGAASIGMESLPPGLQRFVPLLDVSTADNATPQIFNTPPTIDSIRLDMAAGDDAEETPTVKRALMDIPKSLTMRFAIDHGNATLGELMLIASQLTTVPIELELISLDLAGVSVTETLRTPTGWMPIGQWLQQSLATVGLAMEVSDNRLLVYATPQRILTTSGSALRIDDFGAEAEQALRWVRPVVTPIKAISAAQPDAAAIADTVAGADQTVQWVETPDPWTFDAGEIRVIIADDRYALVQAICAVEAARMVRGLAPRLPRWQTSRWIGRWDGGKPADDNAGDSKALIHRLAPNEPIAAPEKSAEPANSEDGVQATGDGNHKESWRIGDWPVITEGPSGTQVDSPRTIAGLLRRLARDNGVTAVVAWRDAMRRQVYPTDLAMPLYDGLTAGALIDELVGEAGLQARDAGQSVWWVGSEAHYDRTEIITWIAIPAGTGEAIADRLATALGESESSVLPVAWDDETLIVRAPRYIARQLPKLIKP